MEDTGWMIQGGGYRVEDKGGGYRVEVTGWRLQGGGYRREGYRADDNGWSIYRDHDKGWGYRLRSRVIRNRR